jgi:hypothetical protein
VLTSAQVRELAAGLRGITPGEFERRLDRGVLDAQSIYPGSWRTNGQSLDSVTANFTAMQALILRLADAGQGLLLYIN